VRTRLICSILVASLLALICHVETVSPARSVGADHEPYSGQPYGNDVPVVLAVLIPVDDDPGGLGANASGLPASQRSRLSTPPPVRATGHHKRVLEVVRHAPCAAPSTGPPFLHASA
jgi:hypothetical protein